MTTNPSRVPAIPAGLTDDELVAAINDRLRRLAGTKTAAAATSSSTGAAAIVSPNVSSAPGTPVASSARIIGLTIVKTALASTANGSTATIAATPELTGATASLTLTYWYSQNGGRQVYWLNWQPYYPGVTTAVDFTAAVPTNAEADNTASGTQGREADWSLNRPGAAPAEGLIG